MLKFWESYNAHMLLPTHRQSENALPVITAYFWIWGGICKGGFDLSYCQLNYKSLITLLRGIISYIWSSKEMYCSRGIALTIVTPPSLPILHVLNCSFLVIKSILHLFLLILFNSSRWSRTLLPSQQVVVNVVLGGFVLIAEVEAGWFVMYWWVC